MQKRFCLPETYHCENKTQGGKQQHRLMEILIQPGYTDMMNHVGYAISAETPDWEYGSGEIIAGMAGVVIICIEDPQPVDN